MKNNIAFKCDTLNKFVIHSVERIGFKKRLLKKGPFEKHVFKEKTEPTVFPIHTVTEW